MRNFETASTNSKKYQERVNFSKIPSVMETPNLISIQKESFDWFITEGIAETFKSISPIENSAKTFMVEFGGHGFGDPKNSVEECIKKDITYEAPLLAEISFINKETGEIKEQVVFMGDFPMMTPQGTFIINGTERVVVSQLVRSPGVYYDKEQDKTSDAMLYTGKIIPARGAWLELETDKRDTLSMRIDRKRKQPATILLRALDIATTDDEIIELLGDYDIVRKTLEKDNTTTREEALIELYRKLRPGEPAAVETARSTIDGLFFDVKRYDLARVGRVKMNKKLGLDIDEDIHTLTNDDLLEIVKYIVMLHEGEEGYKVDDIDHFGNRRIRTVGELIQNQFRIGITRVERVIRERMSTLEVDDITPNSLTNIRPLVAAIKEFFGSSQLSQFMDQGNPLAGMTHKRRLSALGPGGLSRERAGMDVRDVHNSHYGRMCPIETPEGPNIGLIGSLATYAKVNELGFLETPYRKVVDGKVTDDVEYLMADEEEKYIIAQANELYDEETREFKQYDTETGEWKKAEVVLARTTDHKGEFGEPAMVPVDEVDYMDVSPQQMVSVATALIPFLEHDDANRALMGSNMQRQAVPLLRASSPIIGTGLEHQAVLESGEAIVAKNAGVVDFSDAQTIRIRTEDGEIDEYKLPKYQRSNQSTCVNYRPIVHAGAEIDKGDILADGPSSENGELALGQNLLVAYMPWEGYNYEDAIVISERVVSEDLLTSIQISKHEIDARDTKLGPEEITVEVPNISDEQLANLDVDGIIRVGAEVHAGDILVGKVTPKGETELTAEERLLRAIFGEKAREVRDTSLKMPHGSYGRVIDVQQFSRENGDELAPGVNELVRVFVAQRRKISVGDKLSGRHGNKGVISKILPIEDMPYLADGTPVDIIYNPLGVPSRMNMGQLMECHLGWAANIGWNDDDDGHVPGPFKVATPVFDGATEEQIGEKIQLANRNLVAKAEEELGDNVIKALIPQLSDKGKILLYDGRSGEPFREPVTVGQTYVLKLSHMIDDKMHARSTGPYSLITQQPLGGKAQFGGQRFGEMEVWALYAYGASNLLQEMLTVKSDDTAGRVKTYEAIVKGENIPESEVPESFKVLIKEMRSLALDVSFVGKPGFLPRSKSGESQTLIKAQEGEEKDIQQDVLTEPDDEFDLMAEFPDLQIDENGLIGHPTTEN